MARPWKLGDCVRRRGADAEPAFGRVRSPGRPWRPARIHCQARQCLAEHGAAGRSGQSLLPPAKARKPKTPPIPAKAKPLLRRLLEEAAVVDTEDEKAALLSERFDVDSFRLAKARQQVKALDRRTRAADQLLTSASARLRQAAVVAYITGDVAAADASVLSDTQSQGQMAEVYSGVAIGQLRHALGLYEAASAAEHAARTDALAKFPADRGKPEKGLAWYVPRPAPLYERPRGSSPRSVAACVAWSAARSTPGCLRALAGGKPLHGTEPGRHGRFHRGDVRQRAKAAAEALRFLGVPYVFGGAGKSGVDCSGLTMLAWASAGVLASPFGDAAVGGVPTRAPHAARARGPALLPLRQRRQRGDLSRRHVPRLGPVRCRDGVQAAEPGTNVAVGKIYLEGLVSAGRP